MQGLEEMAGSHASIHGDKEKALAFLDTIPPFRKTTLHLNGFPFELVFFSFLFLFFVFFCFSLFYSVSCYNYCRMRFAGECERT